MCGIAGFLGFTHLNQPAQTLEHMTAALQHRGPDAQGLWLDAEAQIALGHRRLAIVDLSTAGQQPMRSADGRYLCVFNGEIYNHHALRKKLERSGVSPQWRGHSDTETLLAGFAHWGIEATLQKTVGMFAIALWDKHERLLTLMRDRMGEKPLYYGWIGAQFAFASELKALRQLPTFEAELDRTVLASYLQCAYVTSPASIYQGIYKLEAGCLLELKLQHLPQKQAQAKAWWSSFEMALQSQQQLITDQPTALACLEQQLQQAVQLQAQADVPLGAFLSGGIDSSLIVSLMQAQHSQAIRTFTVAFEQAGFNEAQHARAVAEHLGTAHTEFTVGAQEALAVIPLLPQLYDEPFADTSQIPTFIISRCARQQVSVALSGDAGDELFGGYRSYLFAQKIWSKLAWLPSELRQRLSQLLLKIPTPILNKLLLQSDEQLGAQLHKIAAALAASASVYDLFPRLSQAWQHPEALVIGTTTTLATPWPLNKLAPHFHEAESAMMMFDTLNILPDNMLCKIDRAAMGASLETRVPFLDHRVVELAWRLPLQFKINQGQGKWLVRQLLYKYVPAHIVNRPKQGFNVPLADWLRGELRDWAEELLDAKRMQQQGYLQTKLVQHEWQQFLKGAANQQRLWCILMFQAWLASQAAITSVNTAK
ncbi:asparagine synthase (glutamine-hydrolysing) [Thiothrix eikelboomii]|uniref:asparagine synthase (glutamine-hydrolyzing) n=1 Tax=Thiothrix eikelboomii TaxID=92487 RepID=A0A1T4WU67_9GAMM|nr:asparagine synthase (glutamine-hydrolyzing) [Thiothrix eikelboomii]SKA80854.1 asparagine synthase (glutamine-hydrolysing) [Thiothrix eikelboomii]